MRDHSLLFPGSSVSLSNDSLNINGSLTVSAASLELHLLNASVAIVGNLLIQEGTTTIALATSRLLTELFSRCSQCHSIVTMVALLLTHRRGGQLSPRPQVDDGHFPVKSLLWRHSNCRRRFFVAPGVFHSICLFTFFIIAIFELFRCSVGRSS